MSTDTNASASSLRQPEFHNASSSFSAAEQLLNKLDTYEASNIFSDTDTTSLLVQDIPEVIGEEERLLAELKLRSSVGGGHWNLGDGTNPPALRQPNLAAVPPEVLGALLKNENYGTFDTVLANSVIDSRNTSSSVKQTMDPPKAAAASGDGDGERTKTSDNAGVDQNKVLVPKSNVSSNPVKFSPLAKEFVPRGVSAGAGSGSDVGNVISQVSSLSLKTSSNNNYNNFEEFQGYPANPNQSYPNDFCYENITPEVRNACLVDTVSDAINQLKRAPAEFNYVIRETIEMLHSYLNDVDTLQNIVSRIITESIAHVNFTYLGARMCGELAKGGVEANGKTFRDILLNSCGQHFMAIIAEFKDAHGKSPSSPSADVHGFTRFFGELYMNLKVEKNGVFENYNVIGLAVVELLENLIKTKNPENVKFATQVLKLVGWQLEHGADPKGKIKQFMDNIFTELETQKTSNDSTPSSVAIIESLEKLRTRDWDYEPDKVGASGVLVDDTNPIYELPDEFDEDWDEDDDDENAIFLDDEPDDVQAAYEEFLREQNQKC